MVDFSLESLFPERNDSTTTGSSTPRATERELALTGGIGDETKAIADRNAAINQGVADQEKLQAAIDTQQAQQAQGLADLDRQDATETVADEARRQQELAKSKSSMERAQEASENFKIEDWWHKPGTARKVSAGLAILAGEGAAGQQRYAEIIMGKAPTAVNKIAPMINKIVDDDFEHQKAEAAKLRDNALAAGQNYDRVSRASKEHNEMLSAGRVLAKKAIVQQYAADLAKSKLPLEVQTRKIAELNRQLGVDKEEREHLEKERASEAGLRSTQTYSHVDQEGKDTGKGPTKDERTDAADLVGEEADLKAIRDYTPDEKDLKTYRSNRERLSGSESSAPAAKLVLRAMGYLPDSPYSGLSPKARAALQAQDRRMISLVKDISGASATESERANIMGAFGFAPDDDAAARSDKLARAEARATEKRRGLGPKAPSQRPHAQTPSMPDGAKAAGDGTMIHNGATYVRGEVNGVPGWVKKK